MLLYPRRQSPSSPSVHPGQGVVLPYGMYLHIRLSLWKVEQWDHIGHFVQLEHLHFAKGQSIYIARTATH
jgi:hypothetical protein